MPSADVCDVQHNLVIFGHEHLEALSFFADVDDNSAAIISRVRVHVHDLVEKTISLIEVPAQADALEHEH